MNLAQSGNGVGAAADWFERRGSVMDYYISPEQAELEAARAKFVAAWAHGMPGLFYGQGGRQPVKSDRSLLEGWSGVLTLGTLAGLVWAL